MKTIKHSSRGSILWAVFSVMISLTLVAFITSFFATQRVKTSSNYAACQRALNNADAGADRLIYAIIHTPDSNNDGIYDDLPPNTRDSWGTKIYDIDNNNMTDFYQLYGSNKNIPDIQNVTEANAIELFITSEDEAWVWAKANDPAPNKASIFAKASYGGCTKKIKVVISAVAGSEGSGITSPLFNAP